VSRLAQDKFCNHACCYTYDRPSSIPYVKVADIENAHQVLELRGVHFEGKPMLVAPMATHDLWVAEFRDPENNVLAHICGKPKVK
jgi:hypothetical protein